ncbi:hypothetical protein SAMN04487884_10992 [Butyrivibrio fibrisolvens]|uniref:Uncharacterized protein n=1 Tax=Butyrivibrio fibrisolvens TaxID=831 RepID=A0A1H9RA43_BUTFI|nr:hypothetical protein [Butyrivibrio fibrisolvens]SER69528.1 hypothetical protein SAMN04487884_10992 [Butyrivibrio fibrisolvens]
MAIALCFTAGTTVFAQEAEENITNNTVTRSVPSGYTFVATYSRTPQTYSIGRIVVTSTSKMYLYIPKNGNLDLGQGTITFTPVSGGSATSFNFTNLSGENKVFDLSGLTPGTYTVRIYAYAYGTSGYVTIYYKYVP